ncbi:hypothetical protein [uncultured Mailhella sp.]|uniref:hypothetical protein n=1 Tax=uncultured Mailhella sp. TaxID=1981031 RepID=UPI00260B955A|nr:hypothetical protein [uncultured Mailhella sp.]
MTTATFDTLGYFGKLKAAGFTEEQARVQAEVLRDTLEKYDDSSRRELATRGDLRETELRLLTEIEKVRGEVEKNKYTLLKWQIGLALAIIAIMAKGFGWLGF